MTTILLLKIALGLASTPSVLVVFRALAKRIGRIPKEKATEVDYLREEVRREREEAATRERELRTAHELEAERLRHIIDARDNEIDGLQGALKEARHDLTTARLFVDGATSTRRDKR